MTKLIYILILIPFVVASETNGEIPPRSTYHNQIRELIYLADYGGSMTGFENTVYELGPLPFHTALIWWTDVTKNKKNNKLK